MMSSPFSAPQSPGHGRNQSLSALPSTLIASSEPMIHVRANSKVGGPLTSNTFAPEFIRVEALAGRSQLVNGIEGENDFLGRRYVWVPDRQVAFVRGWVVEEVEGGRLLVQCEDETVSLTNPTLRSPANGGPAAKGSRFRKRG